MAIKDKFYQRIRKVLVKHGALDEAKAEEAAGARLPQAGAVFISMQDSDKDAITGPAKRLVELGFDIYSTVGTTRTLQGRGVPATAVAKNIRSATIKTGPSVAFARK